MFPGSGGSQRISISASPHCPCGAGTSPTSWKAVLQKTELTPWGQGHGQRRRNLSSGDLVFLAIIESSPMGTSTARGDFFNQEQKSSPLSQDNETPSKQKLSRSGPQIESPWRFQPLLPCANTWSVSLSLSQDILSTPLTCSCLVCKNSHALRFCSITRVRVKFKFPLVGTLWFGLNEMYQHQHSFPFLGKCLPHWCLR